MIGVKCLKGTFFHCDGLMEEFLEKVWNKEDCLDFGGDWINRDFNFDNIFNALETMFLVSNAEGWTPLMYLIFLFEDILIHFLGNGQLMQEVLIHNPK